MVRSPVAAARRDAVLRVQFGVAFCLGGVFYTLEVLGPLHFADLAGDATEGSAVFGIVLALTFVASAAGSALAGTARRTARGSARAAITVLFAAGAALLLVLAVAGSVVLAAVAFGAFYMTNSTTGPLRRQLLHSRIVSNVRAATLSSLSLCGQAGGIVAGLSIPFLAQRSGTPAAFVAAAAVALLTATLALRLPTASPEPDGTA